MQIIKNEKRALAILTIFVLLLATLAGCGNSGTEPTSTESETILLVNNSIETEPVTESPTEASADFSSTETSGTTAAATIDTTTAAPAKPTTTAEIVDYFNKAANKVKTDKPGYTYKARTIIDEKKVSSPNKAIDTIAPPILNMVKGIWANWSDEVIVAKGADHKAFPVSGQSWASRLDPSWVKSAACTDKGSVYEIKIVLKDERVSELPANQTATRHGQVIRAFAKDEVAGAAERVGVQVLQFDALYSGSYVQCTIDKATGSMKSATYCVDMMADMTARVLVTISATIPVVQEDVYIIN